MTVGEKLKRERKKQKLTLEEISQRTKISILFLVALEEDDLSNLPGGIYSRNFLRAYALCLKLDEDILTSEFHEQHVTKPTSVIHREQTSQDNISYTKEKRKGILMIFLFVAILAFLGFMGHKTYNTWLSTINATPGAIYQFKGSQVDKKAGINPIKEGGSTGKDLEAKPIETPPSLDGSSQVISRDTKLESETESEITTGVVESSTSANEIELAEEEATAAVESLKPIEHDATEPLVSPVPDEPGISRPILDPAHLTITNLPKDNPINPAIEELFIIFADRDVWLEVSIDGMEVTRRLLREGSYRAYRYGSENQITCGDFTRIAIQDGKTELSTSHMIPGVRETLQFQRGGLTNVLANATTPEAKEE